MTALAVQFVVTVLVLTVREMCVTQPVSASPSFVNRPEAFSATECQGLVELGNVEAVLHKTVKTEKDRQTCLCKKHENLQYKVDKLKQMSIKSSADLDELANQITCNTQNKDCMYRECTQCAKKKVAVDLAKYEEGQMVYWSEWQTKVVEYKGKDEKEVKKASITHKEEEKGILERLVTEFHEELNKCCKHLFNMKHQFKAVRTLKEKLTENDVLIHVDFSENYNCKCSSEIQSMHFGASQRQITLHTGVMYTKSQTVPFCSLSDSLKHGPAAIWAHLLPVLQMAKGDKAPVSNLYILSDGPTTQYRCKDNFYLMSKMPFQLGFKTVNWNFTEAGHGKGAPDGIGAVMKREADRCVAHGVDIMAAKTLYDHLQDKELSVKLFHVTEDDVTAAAEKLDLGVCTVKGTMKIHQLFTTEERVLLFYRDVSCFSKFPETCECFAPTKVTFRMPESTQKNLSDTNRTDCLGARGKQ